ncbi:hypothetical protein PSEUBRA_000331 [Kalmanozyma brasiliensis GHG001]|uniref:uncharacterized protein n=1 Tax=Kalmanozyma brasiliensis (strain GHG001) TaxID=1365824 RepID=UPI0028681FC4|nr:uncharacterized protein PSEUBRA_000331 [Kalmanozyma brasiliensis GHG001]KAF6766802.1 hypothetical protein PSEUBRA_000331 [Kalmanozyma brasiliensis GHG001]
MASNVSQSAPARSVAALRTGTNPPPHCLARIEALPSELLFYLSRFLDLSSLVLVSRAISHTLRDRFAQFDRELLFLEPAHRLNLSEWREAAQQIDRLGLTQSSSEVRMEGHGKIDVDLSQTMRQLSRDESLIDLHLLQSVLVFLSGDRAAQTSVTTARSPSQTTSINQIRSLHLTGWHGIAGAFLIHQLRSQPSLRDVCTVVKTDRADSRIWEQAAADDQRLREPQRFALYESRTPYWSDRFSMGTPATTESTMVFKGCVATQIIVQVGKRRPRRPEQPYLRGEGLQMGFQGYCIDMGMFSDVAAQTAKTDESVDASAGRAGTRKRLHVILQGREMEDGRQNEEMFERSIVSCNHCKERILF